MKTRGTKEHSSTSGIVKSFNSQDYDKLIKSGKFADDLFNPPKKFYTQEIKKSLQNLCPKFPHFYNKQTKQNFSLNSHYVQKSENIHGKDYQNFLTSKI